jgi:hypothetical protein
MAKVKFGPVVSDARGHSAGTVFSNWRTRPYVRRHTRPANPKTTAQTQIRDAFALQTKRFLRFNSDLKKAWYNYACGKALTDRSAFIGQTVKEQRSGTDWPFTPHDPSVFPVINLQVTPGVGKLTLSWTNDILPSSGQTLAFAMNQTDKALTVTMVSGAVNLATIDITGLTAGKTYLVGVCKKDTSVTPNRYGQCVAGHGTPT